MTDSIERQVAGLKLPEPTPDLDRRIGELLQSQQAEPVAAPSRGNSVLALAGCVTVAGVLGLALIRPNSHPVKTTPSAHSATPAAVVETVEVEIPSLDLPAGDSHDGILSSENIVISTSLGTGDKQ